MPPTGRARKPTANVLEDARRLTSGGMLLLCTDGLWGEVDDEDIAEICASELYTETICARLVQRANANGGRDNITAIAVKVS